VTRQRRPSPGAQGGSDAGFSLVEVMVTMAVMAVVMVLFTAAILQAYRTSTTAESISAAQSQLHRAFQRFDKELRYASWIAQPGQVGTAWYVEFAAADGAQCRQLRFETSPSIRPDNATDGRGVLQLISWRSDTPPATGTSGQTVASQLLTDGVAAPFERQAAGTSPFAGPSSGPVGTGFTTDFDRLRIRLTTRIGRSTAQVDTTFTALNTSRDTPAVNDCSRGRPA
jgi:prepilin-type N-terminal cleavage/methylation domain-containing protein